MSLSSVFTEQLGRQNHVPLEDHTDYQKNESKDRQIQNCEDLRAILVLGHSVPVSSLKYSNGAALSYTNELDYVVVAIESRQVGMTMNVPPCSR